MKRITKVLVVVIVTAILGYSIGSYLTLPSVTSPDPSFQLSDFANYPSLPQSNKTFTAYGQNASFWFMLNIPIANWTKGTEYLMPFYIVKTSQHLLFPYSNATINISDLNVTVNGQPQGPAEQGVVVGNGSNLLTYMYIFSAQGNYSGVTNLTITFHVDLILISGIYWHSISVGTESFSTNFALLPN